MIYNLMTNQTNQTSSVYNKIAELYAKAFAKPAPYIDEFLTLLPKNAKILDAGCGVGTDAGYMASQGFKVIGVDLSEEMLELAKQKFPQIDFRKQDIRKLNFPPNSFAGILAAYSLIHISKKDILALLKKLCQILKKDGAIYIALQEGKSEETFVSTPFKPDQKLFLNVITFDEIKSLLVKAKFSIIYKYERPAKLKNELKFIKLFIIAKKEA